MSKIRVNFAVGQFGKVVGARLVYGTDLLEGIEELCKVNGIQSATILSCFGSFQRSGFVYLIPSVNSPIGVGYNNLVVKEGPIEFLQGTELCAKEMVSLKHIFMAQYVTKMVIFLVVILLKVKIL